MDSRKSDGGIEQPENALRVHLYYPGVLEEAVYTRIDEILRDTFSRYIIELVCYDLRDRRRHSF